jgi:Mce-associated membrane protein
VTRSRIVAGALAVALVASLVTVVLLWRDRDDAEDRASRSEALVDAELAAEGAARAAVTRMTTYDFRTVEDDFSWIDEAGTDKFRTTFTDAARPVIAYIRSVKATAEGTVVDSAATAADPDHVKVLLYVDQQIRSRGRKGADVDQPRITMQMVRQGGEWLVDEVDVVSLVAERRAG